MPGQLRWPRAYHFPILHTHGSSGTFFPWKALGAALMKNIVQKQHVGPRKASLGRQMGEKGDWVLLGGDSVGSPDKSSSQEHEHAAGTGDTTS